MRDEMGVMEAKLEKFQRKAEGARVDLAGAQSEIARLLTKLTAKEQQLEVEGLAAIEANVAAIDRRQADMSAVAAVESVGRELESLEDLSSQIADQVRHQRSAQSEPGGTRHWSRWSRSATPPAGPRVAASTAAAFSCA